MRNFDGMLRVSENKEIIRSYGSCNRRRILFHGFPIRKQFSKSSRFKAVSTQDMIAYFSSFFNQAYINGAIMLFLFLFELDGSGKTCNPSTDDDNIVLHLFTGRQFNAEMKIDIFREIDCEIGFEKSEHKLIFN
jgi:hypothetical protein